MPISGAQVMGLLETQRKLEQVGDDLHGSPFLDAMRDAVLGIQRSAKENAPVDSGRLQSSITPEVRQENTTGSVMGIVGTNVKYAAAMELGAKPHWPPVSKLETWAKRHGVNAFVIARAIARKGIKGRFYMQKAFFANQDRVARVIGDSIAQIVSK